MNNQEPTPETTQEPLEPSENWWITKQAGAYDVRCARCNKAYHFGETIHQYTPPAPFTETWQDVTWCEKCAAKVKAEFAEIDAQPW